MSNPEVSEVGSTDGLPRRIGLWTAVAILVGSTIGSLLQGVSRLWKLFSDHVVPKPESVAMKPKRSLAMTFDHGAGGRADT